MEPDPSIQNWYGGLVDGMRAASGQMYKRNRYYDPATGQFTQPDPIGLAGGLNAYGFADGDPVSYSDPYGLKIKCNKAGCAVLERVLANARRAASSENSAVRQAGEGVLGMIGDLQASPHVVTLTAQHFGGVQRWGRHLVGAPFFPTDVTGPCRGKDRYCPTGREAAASRVDLVPPPLSAVGAETRAVHELGHAHEHIINGVPWSGDSDEKAVDHENNYRTVKGCTHRASHKAGAYNPGCMDN
jgi:RHS repeat-associated protein